MAPLRTLLVLAALLAPSLARAELYTFTDDDGVVHFTNIPNDPRYRLVPDPGTSNTYALQQGGLPRLHKVQVARYDALIREAARYYSLPPALVKAVIAAESAFEPGAISPVGAVGLMQLMPATAREVFVEDSFDPRANVYGGTRYLRYLANLFNGDIRLTIAAYNCGPQVVTRTRAVPNIDETQTYVKRVMAFYEHYLKTWTE